MSPRSDDRGVKRPIDDRAAERLLSGHSVVDEPELTAFVADLLALSVEAPAPSAALSAVLEHGIASTSAPAAAATAALPRRRFARVAVSWPRFALSGAAVFALVLAAASAGLLPRTAQNAVADVVGWVTPVELPHTEDEAPAPLPTQTSPEQEGTEDRESPEPAPSADADGDGTSDVSTEGHDGTTSDDSTSNSGSGSDDSTSNSGSGSDDSTSNSGSGSDDSTSNSGSGSDDSTSNSGSGSDDSTSSGSGSDDRTSNSGSTSSGSDAEASPADS